MPINNINQIKTVQHFSEVARRASRYGQSSIHVNSNGRLAFGAHSWRVRMGKFIGRMLGNQRWQRINDQNMNLKTQFHAIIAKEHNEIGHHAINQAKSVSAAPVHDETKPMTVEFVRTTIKGINDQKLENYLSGAQYKGIYEGAIAQGTKIKTSDNELASFSEVEQHLEVNKEQIHQQIKKGIAMLSNNNLAPVTDEQIHAVAQHVVQSSLPSGIAQEVNEPVLTPKQNKQLSQMLQKAPWNNDHVLASNRKMAAKFLKNEARVEAFLNKHFNMAALGRDYGDWRGIMRANQPLINEIIDETLIHTNAHKASGLRESHMVLAYDTAMGKIFTPNESMTSSYSKHGSYLKSMTGKHASALRASVNEKTTNLKPHIENNQALMKEHLPSGELFAQKGMGFLDVREMNPRGRKYMHDYMVNNEQKMRGVMDSLLQRATVHMRRNLTNAERDQIFSLTVRAAREMQGSSNHDKYLSEADLGAPRRLFGDDLLPVYSQLTNAFKKTQTR